MATITLTNMIDEVAGSLRTCPSLIIEQSYLKTIIDLCQRAHVWQVMAAPLAITPGTYEYTPVSPVAGTEVVTVSSMSALINSVKTSVGYLNYDDVEYEYPNWPEQQSSTTPVVYTRLGTETFMLAPVPDTAGTVTLRLVIRPALSATTWDAALFSEFRRVLFHGVMYDLMLMPDVPWTRVDKGEVHGKQWGYLLSTARIRARKGFTRSNTSVRSVPLA